ncbi:MAG: peptidylprolyl isomerase, partial [Thermoanaerobaculia bacterium]
AELQAFFEQNRARYQTLRTVNLRVLLLAAEPDEHPWQMLKRAEEIAARVRAGEDFAELARRVSRHYSARQGGLIADLTDHGLGRMVQSRARNRKVIEELEIGELSDPLVAEVYEPERLRFVATGVYLVRVEGRQPAVPAEFADIVDLVRVNYLRRHHQELLLAERDATLAAVGLVVHDDHLPPL